MLGKGKIFCDRTIYDKKGQWKSPNNDHKENIFYYISSPLTYVSTEVSGMEELKPSMEIVVFGEKPIIERDIIVLQDGTTLRVASKTINYATNNILVRDMLKQRAESMTLILE